jgi:hypothetical protein
MNMNGDLHSMVSDFGNREFIDVQSGKVFASDRQHVNSEELVRRSIDHDLGKTAVFRI